MSRDVPAAIDSDYDERFGISVYFAEFQFDTDPLYIHTDVGNITTLGQSWLGAGGLGLISALTETREPGAPGIKFRFEIADESAGSIFEELTQQDYIRRTAILYESRRDIVSGDLLADPFEWFRGYCSQPEFIDGEGQSFVDLVVENEWRDGSRSNGRLMEDAELRAVYADDEFFKYQAALVNTKIVWGGRRVVQFGNVIPQPPDPREGPGEERSR